MDGLGRTLCNSETFSPERLALGVPVSILSLENQL